MPMASRAIIHFLESIGVQCAFGITGGPIARFSSELSESRIQTLHCRHETGAAFAALEASMASKKPVLLFVTTGPGLTNALTGIISAKSEGAKLIVVSGYTPPSQRGRYPAQNTTSDSFAQGILSCPEIFDFSILLDHPEDIPRAFARIEQGFQRPNGFIANISLPPSMQSMVIDLKFTHRPNRITLPPEASLAQIKQCVDILSAGPFAIWAGHGARHAWQEIRSFVETTGAGLMCTPRGKGILPSKHPNFIGMTGLGCDPSIESYFSKQPVETLLVLGSKLGEASSFWSTDFLPRKQIIHVDLNPEAFVAAYPNIDTLGIEAEISAFVLALAQEWQSRSIQRSNNEAFNTFEALELQALEGPVRPSFLMQALQQEIIDKTDASILVDVGNAFSFSNRYLNFSKPGRYRVQFEVGSMGCASAGVIGAALGHNAQAFAVVGDGAMLMYNEINTAAQYHLPCVWVVLNDARYGMVAQGLEAMKQTDTLSEFPQCNFAQIARAMGAEALEVNSERQLADALKSSIGKSGPFLIDVQIERSEKAPAAKRFISLSEHGKSK